MRYQGFCLKLFADRLQSRGADGKLFHT